MFFSARIFSRLLGSAALVVTAAGLHSLWVLGGEEGFLTVLLDAGRRALPSPWFWGPALLFVVAISRARGLDRRAAVGPFRSPDADRTHSPEPLSRSSKGPSEGAGTAAPVAAQGRAREAQWSLERLQLGALLKGRKPDVTAFVDALLAAAVERGAGDMHLQGDDRECRVTFRIRGERREAVRYPRAFHADVVRRIKVLAGMKPHVADRPQDGRLTLESASGTVHARVSVVPSSHGETVAVRLAGRAVTLELEELGMSPDAAARFQGLLEEPQGLLVLTGPTGSGKTTTLYSALGHIHRRRGATTHLASIEDPVEVELPFVHQMQVDRARKLGFAEALRALLRQDPDVMMVGEVRDRETAKVAVQAGLSGHLILTTLHADSVVGVFPRLVDLGVEPFLAGSAVVGCVSQRLVRRLCEHCRRPQPPTSRERELLERAGISPEGTFYVPEGCVSCGRSGYSGRTALFEVLVMDGELRSLVATKTSMEPLLDALRERGHVDLVEAGLRAAGRGEIALQETAASGVRP